MERELFRFVHISDLHLGLPKRTRVTREVVETAVSLGFDGWLGHREHTLRLLRTFWRSQAAAHDNDKLALIVTGDLTSMGQNDEFDMVHQYLGGTIQHRLGRGLGLRVEDWLKRAIPGNHDHWPGHMLIVGEPRERLGQLFPDLPSCSTIINLDHRRIRLIRINTDSEVGVKSPDRVFARGRCSNQFGADKLATLNYEPNEIRVLLMHHSYLHRAGGPTRKLELEDESRNDLESFLLSKRVSVVLTGHMHKPLVRRFALQQDEFKRSFLEGRCGSTTQIDKEDLLTNGLISEEEAREKRFADWADRATLLVHRVIERDQGLFWIAETYERNDLEETFTFVNDHEPFKIWPLH